MDPITKDQVIEWLSTQSPLELSDLIAELGNRWGVKPQEAGAPIIVSDPVKPATPEVEKTEFTLLFVKHSETNKIGAIKAVRALTGLGLKESKDFVEAAPKVLRENMSKDDAERFKAALEAEGVTVELR